jgi:CHASE2 domain-containing sensor protein
MDELTLNEFIADKFVFIGASVPGYNDFANSPVHGLSSGVYMHAMALDNFLSFGSHYKISADWTLPPHPDLVVPGLVSIAIVFLVNLGWQKVRKRFKTRAASDCQLSAQSTLGQRMREAVMSASGWVLRMSLQSIIAIILISVLQTWFRIGMLPVVELVGMTLVAEGLGYMSRIRWLISGPPENKFCRLKKEANS